jgi:hypothetical protein
MHELNNAGFPILQVIQNPDKSFLIQPLIHGPFADRTYCEAGIGKDTPFRGTNPLSALSFTKDAGLGRRL